MKLNHRIARAGADLWRTGSATPLPRQAQCRARDTGTCPHVPQERVLNVSRERLHSRPGQLVSVVCHPPCKEVLPHPPTGHHQKEPGTILVTPSFKILYILIWSEDNILVPIANKSSIKQTWAVGSFPLQQRSFPRGQAKRCPHLSLGHWVRSVTDNQKNVEIK